MRATNKRQWRGRPGHPGRPRRPGAARRVRPRVRPRVQRVQGVRTDPEDLMPKPYRGRWSDAIFLVWRDGEYRCTDPAFDSGPVLAILRGLAGLDLERNG